MTVYQSMRFSFAVCGAPFMVGAARASLIVNGGFEQPALSGAGTDSGGVGSFTRFSTSTFAPGWILTAGNVEIFHTFGSDSEQSLDLTGFPGSAAATIEQTIPTISGVEYTVEFDLIGGGSAAPVKHLRLNVLRSDDTTISNETFHFDSLGLTLSQLAFARHTLSFLADDSEATIQFTSLHTANSNGPIIDNVNVTAVPEPGSGSLMLCMLCLSVLCLRRRARPYFV